jgi:hypothetical protein
MSLLFAESLELNADCVECVPALPHLVTVGAYQLDESTRQRRGLLRLYSVMWRDASADGGAGFSAELLESVSCVGVLDVKWCACVCVCDLSLCRRARRHRGVVVAQVPCCRERSHPGSRCRCRR